MIRQNSIRSLKCKQFAKTKTIIIIALFVSLLLVAQVALSALNGIEIITVLLASFVFCYGIRMGVVSTNIFIVVRCIVFGFFPSVMILYAVYYNLFVVVFGLVRRVPNKQNAYILSVICACLMTLAFTLLDDIVTPLYFGFGIETTKAYWLMSLTVIIPQEICTLVTMLTLFPVLTKTFTICNERSVA